MVVVVHRGIEVGCRAAPLSERPPAFQERSCSGAELDQRSSWMAGLSFLPENRSRQEVSFSGSVMQEDPPSKGSASATSRTSAF
jgi:hypothetical protein